MRISALLSIFSVCLVFQVTIFAQTSIIDIFKSLNLEGSAFSADQIFSQINDFLASPGLEKPISLEFLTINAFVPGISRLIDASNFRPDLMILIYDFINVFEKGAQGRNILLNLTVEKVRRFLGCQNQEFDQAVQECLICRSLSSLSSIFHYLFTSINFSILEPTKLIKLENLLKFLSELVCRTYKHFHEKSPHDQIQPILYFCDTFIALETKEGFLCSELFLTIKEFFKMKAISPETVVAKEYLESGKVEEGCTCSHEVRQSSKQKISFRCELCKKRIFFDCKSCSKKIFFGGLHNLIFCGEFFHQVCFFEGLLFGRGAYEF